MKYFSSYIVLMYASVFKYNSVAVFVLSLRF